MSDSTPFAEREVLCCKMKTFLVGMNCLVGVAMVVFGVLNFFSAFTNIGGTFILSMGFFFYQM